MKTALVIPAGRRRYLKLCLHYALREQDLFDEIQLWVNTIDQDDINYIYDVAIKNPKIRLIGSPAPLQSEADIPANHHRFYSLSRDPDTVYIRLDDDIVWIEEGALEKLLTYRVENVRPFIVYGNIINNAYNAYLHQQQGALPVEFGRVADNVHGSNIAIDKPRFSESTHNWFLAQGPSKFKYDKFVCSRYERVSVNVISYFGAQLPSMIPIDEEYFFAVMYPRQLGIPNEICGSAVFVHYAYGTQRPYLDTTNVLSKYYKRAGI